MIAEVAARDLKTWTETSKEIGSLLRQEIAESAVGRAMRESLDRQTALITSLPTEAAQRVRDLTIEGISKGTRASEIAAKIMETGEVTKSRANLIARTETSGTATELTKARAESIGSTGYIWRTSGDSDVRPSHRKMAGQFVAWGDPPTLDGMTGHAGGLPNCRCWPDPVLPKVD